MRMHDDDEASDTILLLIISYSINANVIYSFTNAVSEGPTVLCCVIVLVYRYPLAGMLGPQALRLCCEFW